MVSVANHVKARRSLIERSVMLLGTGTKLAELEVHVPPFAVVSSAMLHYFWAVLPPWMRKRKPLSCLFTFGNKNKNLYLPIV